MHINIIFDYNSDIDDCIYTLSWEGDDDKPQCDVFDGKNNFKGMDEGQIVEEMTEYAECNLGVVNSKDIVYTDDYENYINGLTGKKRNRA